MMILYKQCDVFPFRHGKAGVLQLTSAQGPPQMPGVLPSLAQGLGQGSQEQVPMRGLGVQQRCDKSEL